MIKPSVTCYFAEFIGTAALVFFAAGSVMVSVLLGGLPGPLISGIASGMIVMIMVWALFEVSGAHLNPALTFALWLSGEFPSNRVAGYVCAQLVGSVAAAAALYLALGNVGNMGANLPNGALGIGATSALLIEFMLSFLMMLVIKASFHEDNPLRQFASVPIGGIVGIEVMLMGPVAGAAMNPARAFGPTMLLGDWSAFWIYVIGPVAGLLAGSLAWTLIRSSKAH